MSKGLKIPKIILSPLLKNLEARDSAEFRVVCRTINSNIKRLDDPKEYYINHRELERNPDLQGDAKIAKIIKIGDADNVYQLFAGLAIGDKQTPFYLASSFLDGEGIPQNDDLMHLFIALGVKLKDQATINMVDGGILPDKALKCADRLLPFINVSAEETEDRPVSRVEAFARAKALDSMITRYYGVSVMANFEKGDFIYEMSYVLGRLYPHGLEWAIDPSERDVSTVCQLHDGGFIDENLPIEQLDHQAAASPMASAQYMMPPPPPIYKNYPAHMVVPVSYTFVGGGYNTMYPHASAHYIDIAGHANDEDNSGCCGCSWWR